MPMTEECKCRVVRILRPAEGREEGFAGVTDLGKHACMDPAESIMKILAENDRKSFSNILREDGPCYLQKVAPCPLAPRGGLILRAYNNEYVYAVYTEEEFAAMEFESKLLKRKPNYGRFTGV